MEVNLLSILLTVFLILTCLILPSLFNIVVTPYLKIRKIKNQFKDRVYSYYYPFKGILQLTIQGEQENKDAFYQYREIIDKNPNIDCVVTNSLGKIGYYFVDPEHAKYIFQNQQNYKKVSLGYFKDHLTNYAIGHLEGKDWKTVRQLLGPFFNYSELIKRFDMINGFVQDHIDNLLNRNLDTKQLSQEVQKIAGNIVIQSFFKLQTQNQETLIKKTDDLTGRSIKILFYNAVLGMKMLFLGTKATQILRTKQEQELVDEIADLRSQVGKQIDERIELRNQPDYNPKEEDFLDAQLNNKEISRDIIIDQFIGLYAAGTDTTLNTFLSMLYFISKEKQVQQKLRQEIQTVIGNDTKYFKPEHLKKLDYLSATIQETLRLRAPAGLLLMREALFDHKIGDYSIKKGDTVNVIISSMGYNKKYFSSPEQFKPERWIENQELQNSFVFSPFSAGSRNCMGKHLAQMELKVLAVRYLLNFELDQEKGYQPIYEQRMSYKLKDTNFLKLKPLKK